MDRATRKANLKKLQLPNTSGSKQQRKTLQTAKSTTTTNAAITNYFLTPEKQITNHIENVKNCDGQKLSPINKKPNEVVTESFVEASVKPVLRNRSKRTKLDAFIFKDPNDVPDSIKNTKKSLNDDDLVLPEKKAKKAPKIASTSSQAKTSKMSRSRKQTTIKSAFLRNEQLFAEIAAQHCAADQFDGDDVQLALAISKSEAESKGLRIDNEVEDEVNLVDGYKIEAESIREKLKKYGFRTAEKNDYNTFAAAFLSKTNARRPKSKWVNKFTALTLRTPENQLKKLQENIEKLLHSQFRTKPLNAQESLLPPYKLLSSILRKSDMHEKKKIIQTIENVNRSNDQYFVTELFEVNNLPAGHLLKDWNAIQGRDLTPNNKSKQTMQSLKKIQNIYQELEEYFSSKKLLNLTLCNEDKQQQEEVVLTTDNEKNKKEESEASLNTAEALEDNGNLELNKMVDLIEDLQRNEAVIENIENDITSPNCDNKIKKLLPSPKSLDTMQVSSSSINTQATIHSTQNQRSNSPDLFADSDMEMEELENATEKIKTKVEAVINIGKERSRNSSIEDIEAGVTTYEVFSSDEVKNTSSSKPNEPTEGQETPTTNCPALAIIDLTQDDLELSKHNQTNHNLNKSKPIVEIDIFAESPIQEEDNGSADINSNSQVSKYLQEKEKAFKLSLTPGRNDKELLAFSLQTQNDNKEVTKNNKKEDVFEFSLSPESEEPYKEIRKIHQNKDSSELSISPKNVKLYKEITNTKKDSFEISLSSEILESEEENNKKGESFKLSLSLEIPQELKETIKNDNQMEEEDMLLREIAMDQTNTSFLNFQGSKQLENCFHKETVFVEKEENIKDNLTGNDTIFQELCNKYLKGTTNTSSLPSNNLQKTDFNKSFSQMLPFIQTPQKSENFTQFTMDFDITADNNVTLKRNSMSFTAKTPLKMQTNDCYTKLSKSYSFNNSNMENNSIDLTQNDEGDDQGKVELEEEEDDDCLILSDDEINYSIWQANKTANFKTSDQIYHEEDVISLPDNEEVNEEEKNLSKEMIVYKNKTLTKTSLPAEESYSDFEILTPKYDSLKSPSQDDLKFDRSEFGILEEYSQPDYTPNLCTPTKVLNEASFLSSPTETTAPMKRYSNCHRSSQKFKDLINNIEAKSPSLPNSSVADINNDFDEFDRSVYTSPFITKTPIKKPQGIEQLLTAEISFQGSQKSLKAKKSPTVTTLPKPFKMEKQEIKCNNKTYIVRSVTSPKPDYTKYSEAELLKELYNFGIKPLKRKQAVKMLEYIYNQTHPIIMEEDEEITVTKDKDDVIDLEDFDRPSTSKEALKANAVFKEPSFIANDNEKVVVDILTNIGDKKLNLQDSCGWEMLRYSVDLKAELLDEQYILQTNVTKKTTQPLLPFHIAWYNLVCSNRKLHETILMYEPIDLQEIYLFLKGLGYRYDPKDLKIFFDRRCIIFRYDLTSATNSNGKAKDINRHVRKSKKSKDTKK